MTSSKSIITTIKGEDEFQAFCLDLFKVVWANPRAMLYGRRGTSQRGIDIVGEDKRFNPPERSGVQCKGTETNKPREPDVDELRKDVEKAKAHDPPLRHFAFAYAGPRNPDLQDEAAKLTQTLRAQGLFEVDVYCWDDLLDLARKHPAVMAEHIPVDLGFVERGFAAVAVRIEQDERPAQEEMESYRRIEVTLARITGGALASVDGDAGDEGEDKSIHDQLDVAKALILAGRPAAALDVLNVLQERMVDTVGARAKFRLQAQLGHAYLALDDIDNAVAKFAAAADLAPKQADACAYIAYADRHRGDRSSAFDFATLALEEDPEHLLAQSIWAESAPPTVTPEQIEAQVGASAQKDPDIARILSRRWIEAKNLERALHWANIVGTESKFQWLADASAGEALLEAVLEDEMAKLGGEIDKAEQDNITQAAIRFERAWSVVKHRPDAARWAYIGTNLASAYALAGRTAESHAIIDEAFRLAPDDAKIRQRKAAADVPRGRAKEAWAVLKAGPEPDAKDIESRHFFAEVALAADENDEALSRSLPLVDELAPDRRHHIAWVALMAAMELSDKDRPYKLFTELRAKFAPDPGVMLIGAEAARKAGDFAAAEKIEAELQGLDLNTLSPVQRFEYALAMNKREQYSLAADALKGLYRANRAGPPLYEALVALLNADRRVEAVALYEALSPEIRSEPRYRRVGAAIYSRLGRVGQAIAELEALLVANPDDLRSRLDWVRTLYRSGDEKRAKQWLKSSVTPTTAEPSDLMELAHHWDMAGRPLDAVNLAYQVLRDHWGSDEEIHNGYLGLFLARPMRAKRPKNPKAVEPDTWVELTDTSGGGKDERTIESQLTPDPAKKEIGPEHELAKKLLGKKVGDEIEFGGTIPERRRIDTILHKTIRLLHRALDQHASLFPGSGSIGRVSVDLESDNPFDEMKRMTRERADFALRAEAGYIEGHLPLSVFARIVHVDPYSAWGGLVQRGVAKIRIARGDPQSRQLALHNLRQSQGATIDPLTFYQWREFGILELAIKRFGKLYVAQSFFDLIAQTLDEAKRSRDAKGGTLAWEGGRMVLHENTADQQRATVRYWEDVLAEAKRCCQVVAVESLTALGGSADVASIIPGPFVDAIAVALEQHCIFLSDDVVLRDVATLCKVERSAWCQPLMAEAQERGIATALDSAKLVQQLIKHNSAFVTVHPEELTAAMSDYELTKDLFIALSQATPPSVATVLTQHVWQAWNDGSVSFWARNTLAVRIVEHLRKHHPFVVDMMVHQMMQTLEAQEDEWSTDTTSRSRNARATLLTAMRVTRDPTGFSAKNIGTSAHA